MTEKTPTAEYEEPTDNKDEEIIPVKVEIINHKEEKIIDKTSWEEPDPWDFTKMTEQDIKEAEESRIA